MTDSVNLRSVALDIILEVNENKEFTHVVLNNALTKYQYLDKNKRAFITRLTTGTIEANLEMDYIINQFSKTPVKKMKPVIKNILRMSVYQLIYMDSVPDSAVCNEAVKLASKRGFTGLKGFVNGVLRNIARNKDNIEYPDKEKDILSYLSVKYSIDRWILDMWKKNYSDEEIADILSGIRKDKKTYIRCNTLKAKPQDIKEMLEKEGVKVN
ncbi:MAG: 16S rRNA (cytosine(967)-C(5))-methyltransferase, partial [Lachnospira sp.]|nr:16S rRNA (cytosine(967)-C(5))-methyltransferase [Lachnospira sp.]